MLDRIQANPPHKIGIIGGGQLGKMMTIAAKQMGFHVTILDPVEDCPAAQVADRQIVAKYDDCVAITDLVQHCQVTTYEFEHIDSDILIELDEKGWDISPNPSTLKVIQNKLSQKGLLKKQGIPVPEFLPVTTGGDVERAAAALGYPLLLKACTGGYDGKGNYVIRTQEDIKVAMETLNNCSLMVEAFVPFTHEVSVMVARSASGQVATYPLSENEHEENILIRGIVPARVSEAIATKSREIAAAVMDVFQGVGIFCVEMFVTEQGNVLVNEVAPRPHNSGHYTIEACRTSQFEQHIRAITDLPLGSTKLLAPVVMINLLGESGHSGPAVVAGCGEALAIPGCKLHFYGKKETVPKRKMGHATITASTLEEALEYGDRAKNYFKIISGNEEE
ncbi:5-(carboxyamino)imidazole ribonucleotide synthase [Desulfitispora alkaliphila]|uniref:5-(carboxyamino)imidazole ribonucleotide synthase n=1 Tax=Desulfitispora alkaliphila TaxID=622674 RepID=UPI003D24CB68